jgi:hypothetical protein
MHILHCTLQTGSRTSSLFYSGYCRIFSCMKLITYLHPVLRLRLGVIWKIPVFGIRRLKVKQTRDKDVIIRNFMGCGLSKSPVETLKKAAISQVTTVVFIEIRSSNLLNTSM